jgi:hypothetical protein
MANNDKTDSSIPGGTGGSATPKPDSTASAKAAARKKHQQQQQKNHKANPPQKKKQPPQVTKSTFEGIASGVSPMKGIVIAQGHGNLAGQFRLFQKKLAGAAADDKAYGLDSVILDLIPKVKSDFVKPKPDPLVHSDIVDVLDEDKKKTGERKLVCHNPVLKDQMEAEYSMDLKIQKSNWNQFERHYEGYYRTAIGNIEDTIMTYCRADIRMVAIESNKDLVGLLLVLRSVCAQNNGAVKVDEEYQNLTTLHSAVGYKQKKNVSDTKFADEVADRYGSSIFTSGKFTFGLKVYENVLKTYASSTSRPLTFIEYLNLSKENQAPIDALVKERTVARLIVKNSLNDRLRDHLQTSYSTTDDCYPNTINDALSLLSTFVKSTKDSTGDEAVVSYHETTDDDGIIDCDDIVPEPIDNDNDQSNDNVDVSINEEETSQHHHVSFDETVMASIIAEATAEDNNNQFIGASFGQLQDVEDAFEDDEPDVVCCAHIHINDDEEEDDNYETGPPGNIHNNHHPNPNRAFELVMYHTSQRINNLGNVYTINYDSSIPDLISYNYDSPTPGTIVDYADAIRLKLKLSGIHDTSDLLAIFEGRSDAEAACVFRRQLKDVEQQGFKTSTVRILKEETVRRVAHTHFNILRYHQMVTEIGDDVDLQTFPKMNVLLHHVVSAVAINQRRHKPNRWVNRVTHKLIKCEINTVEQFEAKLNNGSLNNCLRERRLPRFHQVTIQGFKLILGTADFRQGRF